MGVDQDARREGVGVRRADVGLLVGVSALVGVASTFGNTVPQAAVGAALMAITATAIVWAAEHLGWVSHV